MAFQYQSFFNENTAANGSYKSQAPLAGSKKPVAAVPPAGPTGFWNRITQVGVGQVNLLNIGRQAKSIGGSIDTAARGTATGVARMLPGGQNDAKNQQQQVSNANKATQQIIQMQKAGKISKPQATKLLQQQAGNASQGSSAATKTLKSEPTTKEFAGDVAQTATLVGGGGGKAVEVTGEDLLKTFGTQGVKDLAEKAGVDVGGKGAIEGAKEVAQTKVAQQAFKKASSNFAVRAVKSSAKGAGGLGIYSAGQEAGAGGSNKQILKAGETGAKQGAILGVAGSLLKSGVKAKFGKTPTIEKGTAPKDTTLSPVTKLDNTAKAAKALTPPKTKLLGPGTGRAEGKGFTMTPSADAAKVKMSARLNTINQKLTAVAQGKTTMASEDIKALKSEKADIIQKSRETTPLAPEATPAKTEQGSGVKSEQTTSETPDITRKGMGEEGGVAPGQAVKDVQDLIEKHQATTKYSGDIQRGGDMVEGAKKQIASDAVKVAKNTPKMNAIDKSTLQNYRDSKEAGLPTSPLPERLQKANDEITALNKASVAAKQEQAKLEGREYTDNVNPETYVHREAQGKGTNLDQLLQGSRKSVSGATSFGKRTGSDKGRVFQAVTDAKGDRRVVAIKNESFGTTKHLTGFDEKQKPIDLGKHSYSAESNTLTNSKGEKLTLGQATTQEITKASGQKYYTDPHLTSLKNYVDSRTALENVKFIESIKNHPDFEKFASPPGETAPKGYEPVHGLFQFMGYKFEPKTAEALRDIVKNSSDETALADKVGNFLKKTIVYFPLKHNLNQTATYAVDRGLSSLVNPMAYKRGAVSLVKAFHEVTNEGPIFQKLQKAGFSLPSTDEKAFTEYVSSELKSLDKNDPRLVEMAKSFGTTPARLYNAVTHTAVWQYGDILNTARVIERMSNKTLSKGMDFESAMKATEKYSLQYKVPSRVGPTKLGRSISRTLQSPKVFFGRYRYDLFKIMGNTIKDSTNLKTLAKGGKENLQAVDKLAAMAFGAALVWPLADKGLQKLSGDPNAYTTAPGALQLPELLNKVRTGKESPETAIGNQAYVSGTVTIPLELQANRDSFTGKNIYDPNASTELKAQQTAAWLKGQSSFGQKAATLGNTKGNKAVDTLLGIAGTNFPKNSSGVTKLDSLQYDSLPGVQSNAKALAKKGDFTGAQKAINQYDVVVLAAAKSALKTAGKPVPSDSELIKTLKKSGTYYAPQTVYYCKLEDEETNECQIFARALNSKISAPTTSAAKKARITTNTNTARIYITIADKINIKL